MNIDQKITASQTISSETNLKTLLEKMLLLLISKSGAELGVFLLKENGDWYIEAVGSHEGKENEILLHNPIDFANDNLVPIPESVFNYCCRTKEQLVVGNTLLDDRVAKDTIVHAKEIKCLVCIPVVEQGHAKAMIYLENKTMNDVFTPDRMEVLEHLTAQFGISVDNALLYRHLKKKMKVLKESEERYRTVFENAKETIIVFQEDTVKYCNQMVEELIGYSLEEITSIGFEKIIHPDDLIFAEAEFHSQLSGEKPASSYTIRILAKDGRTKYVIFNSALIRWEGRPASLALLTDITELKMAEIALKKSEEFNRSVLMSIMDNIAIIDSEGNIQAVNDEWIRFARKNEAKDLNRVGPDINYLRVCEEASINGDKIASEALEGIRSVLDGSSEKFEMEYPCDSPNAKRWFLMSVKSLKEINGGVIIVHTDITSRKMTEDKLQISEQRYELAVSGSNAGIWSYNVITDEAYISDRFKELLGYGPYELKFSSAEEAWSYLHPDFREKAPRAMQDHLEKKVPYYSIDYLARMKSGEYRWFQARGMGSWDENGNPTQIAGSLVDIHEQKIAEEKIKKSERHFRHLMEASPLATAIFAPDGKIRQVNAAWKKLWGFNEEETVQVMAKYNFLTDKQIEDLGFKPLVERAFKGESIILPAIEYEGSKTTKEIGLKELEAQTPTIQVHIYPIKETKGEIDSVVAINMDLTELRRAERIADIQRESLARIDRTSIMGQLTGSIAHELNQPLTGILANAQAAEIMLQSDTLNSKELSEILEDIVADTKRAGDVIRNLRNLYKRQTGVFYYININSVIEETVNLLHSELVKRDVKLKKIIGADIPQFKGNKIQIQQVLVNLIMNAIEAMSGINAKLYEITITTNYNEEVVNLHLEDKGPGIDEDKIDSIFEPLATWKSGGTGMGLAISNSIIESHGGRMYAENLSGGGARVGFEIPIIDKI